MLRVVLPRPPVQVRLAALLGLPLMAGGCSASYALMSPGRLHHVPNADLCANRGNLVSGPRLERELRRRGVDCSAIDEALLAGVAPRLDFGLGPPPGPPPLPPAVHLAPPVPLHGRDWRSGVEPPPLPPRGSVAEGSGSGAAAAWQPGIPPPPFAGAAPAPELPDVVAEALPPPEFPGGATAPSPRGGRAVLSARTGSAVPPDSAPRAAIAGGAESGGAVAPLVAPGCAERIITGAGSSQGAGGGRAVAFRNGCRFPIRVRFAARPGSALTEVTGLLRPGERSGPAPLAEGFAYPGYVVCSYERAPERALCR